MKKEVADLLKQERKYERELADLRRLRLKVQQQKAPDAKVLKMIDDEIASMERQA